MNIDEMEAGRELDVLVAEAATGTEAIALALARAVVKAKGVETAP